MLQAAGQSTTGVRGALRVRGLLAVWAWASRAFERDEQDLSATMAALVAPRAGASGRDVAVGRTGEGCGGR